METQEEIEVFLAHHGIKGMHWGVRKEREEKTYHNAKKVDYSEVSDWLKSQGVG